MRSLALALVAAAFPAAAQQAATGAVRTERAAVEVLPTRAGASEIRTPEGFLRVEGGTIAPGAATFGVYQPGAYQGGGRVPPPPAWVAAGGAPEQQGRAAPARDVERCRPERSRYLRRLLYMVGIYDIEDPVAFLDGLAGREGAAGQLLFTAYGLLPGIDPVKPLGWDLELRSLARELAACQSGGAR